MVTKKSTISTTRIIDKKAKIIFESTLPVSWLIREQNPDIHIDYYVELEMNGEPSGVLFGVQLKGIEKPRYKDSFLVLSLKTKHLSYYIDKVKQPVFLVVVDVERKMGFWVFIQELIKEKLIDLSWRSKNKVSVKVPLENKLDETNRIFEAVLEAEKYMRELWPSSLNSAAEFEKNRLERLDPRVEVNVGFVAGKTTYEIWAKEELGLNLNILKNDENVKSLKKFLDNGESVAFDGSEVEINGSPFDEILNEILRNSEGRFFIEPNDIATGIVTLKTKRKNGDDIFLQNICGGFKSGAKNTVFSGCLKRSPLKISVSFEKTTIDSFIIPEKIEMKAIFEFVFDFSLWSGIPIFELPYFDKLIDFFSDAIREDCIFFMCEMDGCDLLCVELKGIINNIGFSVYYINLIKKLRVIAGFLRVNPVFQGFDWLKEYKDNLFLDILHDILEKGEYRNLAYNKIISSGFVVDKENVEIINSLKKPTRGSLKYRLQDPYFYFFEKNYFFGYIEIDFTDVTLLTEIDCEQLQGLAKNNEKIDLAWECNSSCEIIAKFYDPKNS